MTKAEEIEAIRELAARLGPDAYCGPWLAEVADMVESDIRADMHPTPTLSATRRFCDEVIATAKERADGITSAAYDRAAEREGNVHRQIESAASALRTALKNLGDY